MFHRSFSTIKSVLAREILDSRCNPTLEVDIATADGLFSASVPSGKSTGTYEAFELRDRDFSRYQGDGVLKACKKINSIISPALKGKSVTDQLELDRLLVETLDGSKNEWGWSKENLGANSTLATSFAIARAGAASAKIPLFKYIALISGNNTQEFQMPVPIMNLISGGSHADNQLAMQEFLILPTGARTFAESIRLGVEVYHSLKSVISKKYGKDATNVADEGTFAPNIKENAEGITLMLEAIHRIGYSEKVKLGIDAAASEFYVAGENTYDLDFKCRSNDKRYCMNAKNLANIYTRLAGAFPIAMIEDPFDQDDWEAYQKLTKEIGNKVQVVGDYLLATNQKRIMKAVKEKTCNSVALKANQIGSLSEMIEAWKVAKEAGWHGIIGHRSGETEDSFIADLAVGLGTGQIKAGAPCRSERLAKYNQLLRIEETLGKNSFFAGETFSDSS